MPTIDAKKREIKFRLVYFGPGLAGKTTNLAYVFDRTKSDPQARFICLMTTKERTLAFDFLTKTLRTVNGLAVRIELVTVPGPLYRDPARRLALVHADGVVFVADSQVERSEANADSMEELAGYLESHGTSIGPTPLVIQFNKRELPNAMPVAELTRLLNPYGVAQFEATALLGIGVFDTLKAATNEMLARSGTPPSGRLYRD